MIPWRLSVTRPAEKDMEALPARDLDAVARALDRLAEDPFSADIKKLQGERNLWRLRVGSWRVRFRFDKAARTLEIQRILPRREAYRDR